LKSHIALFIVGLIYGLNFVVAKGVMPYPIGPMAFVFLRVGFAAAMFWLLQCFWPQRVEKQDIPKLLACAFFGVALNQGLFFKGISLTTPIHASLLMMATPVLVLLLTAIWLKEKASFRKWMGVALGISGGILLILQSHKSIGKVATNPFWGDIFVTINAASYGFFLVLVKPLMSKYRPDTVMAWCFLFGLPMVFVASFGEISQIGWHDFQQDTWITVAYVLVFVTFFAYLLNAYALRRVSPSVVSVYIYLQPLFATLLSVGLGMESFSLTMLISGLMIGIGVWLVSRG
jgi:drug/metabolite transporter (DMT)-like permease